MKIYIKNSNGKSFMIPVPIGLLQFGLGIGSLGRDIIKKYVDDETYKYIECIDFHLLSKSFYELKRYKGLVIVDIKTNSGEVIKIVV